MKQSDIFSIIIIATVGTLVSYFAVNSFLGNPDEATATITTINEISPDLVTPDSELFNPDAINPTVEVMIDGCKDLDHNGIIDYAELVACDKVTPDSPEEPVEEEEEEIQLFTCSDGTKVLEESLCQNKQQQSENPTEGDQGQQQQQPEGGDQGQQQQPEGQ